MAIYLSNVEVGAVLDMASCIELFEEALRELAEGRATNEPRAHGYLPGRDPGTLFRMKLFHGGVASLGAYAVRVVTDALVPGTVAGMRRSAHRRGFDKILVFSLDDGDLIGIVEDDLLQRIRVGAESAVVARKLARPDAGVVGLLGSGRQAATQLHGLAAVRPLREVRVYSPTREHRETFAARMTEELRVPVSAVGDARDAVAGADLVVTATNTSEPVLHGSWLEPGMHVISLVNSDKRLRRRELDDEVLRRCDPIVISARDQVANDEPADIFEPLRAGLIDWQELVPMVELFADHPGRRSDDQVTLHKNNGMSIQFVAAAAAALDAARELGLGLHLPDVLQASGAARPRDEGLTPRVPTNGDERALRALRDMPSP